MPDQSRYYVVTTSWSRHHAVQNASSSPRARRCRLPSARKLARYAQPRRSVEHQPRLRSHRPARRERRTRRRRARTRPASVGSLGFTHWVRPRSRASPSASACSTPTKRSSGGHVRTNAITPLLFGVSYSPRALALSSIAAAVLARRGGPVLPFGLPTPTCSAEPTPRSNRSPACARRSARTGSSRGTSSSSLEGDYHAVGEFDQKDAATKNPAASACRSASDSAGAAAKLRTDLRPLESSVVAIVVVIGRRRWRDPH